MNSLSTVLHENGASMILFLQQSFPGYGDFFMKISHIGDPSLVFTLYFPLVAALNLTKAVTFLWTVLFCEWTNMILKWVLAGDRPFWWINESPEFREGPTLEQFRMTCETGPGMPSGHSTLNAAVFYLIVSQILESDVVSKLSRSHQKYLRWLLWCFYTLWISLVVLSRSYIAAHFPHQCVAGVMIGLLSVFLIRNLLFLKKMTYRKGIVLTSSVLASVACVFGSYTVSGGDPMWSVSKAVQWCANPAYINIDSKPFYSLSRFSGVCLGLSLSISSKFFKKIQHMRETISVKVFALVFNIFIGKMAETFHKNLPSSIPGYYLMEFILNASMTFLIATIIPYSLMNVSRLMTKKKTR